MLFRSIRNTKRFFGQKPNVSVSGSTGGGWWQKLFDVIVTDNLFGDMLSDVAPMNF